MKEQNKRNLALALLLVFIVLLFSLLTIYALTDKEAALAIKTPAYGTAIARSEIGKQLAPSELLADGQLKIIDKSKDRALIQTINSYSLNEAYDMQALPLLESSSTFHWQPHFVVSMALVVDRTQTETAINSFADLQTANLRVSLPADGNSFRYLISAMSLVLDEHDSFTNTIALLSSLQEQGLLARDDAGAPVRIMFDQAAVFEQMQNPAAHLEIIIPAEGSISFEKGLLSRDRQQDLLADTNFSKALVESGLRLPDGSSSSLYPPASAYAQAVKIDDYTSFNLANQDITRLYRRQVLRTRLYTTADSGEHMLSAMLFIALTIIWASTVIRRVLSKDIRSLILAAALMLLFWTVLRIIKYQLPSTNLASRFLWYSYYLGQLSLPLILLRIASLVDSGNHQEKKKLTGRWKAAIVFNLLLLLLVLTNDLHMLVFKFDPLGNWSDQYSYGPVYYLVIASNIIFFLSAIASLLLKARRSPFPAAIVFPIFFSLSIVVYALAYVLRLPLAWESDFTVTVGLFSLLFMQSAIHTGLIPLNRKYSLLFAHSPLSLEILDKNGQIALESEGSRSEQEATRINLHQMAIKNGSVFWYEDLQAVQTLQNELKVTLEELKKTNEMLQHQYEIQAKLETTQAKEQIQKELELLAADSFTTLNDLVQELKTRSNPTNKNIQSRISILLSYVKRSYNLHFWGKKSATINSLELQAYLDELARHARAAGVTCAVMNQSDMDLKIEAATAVFSFFFAGLWAALETEQKELIARLSTHNKNLSMQLLSNNSLAEHLIKKENPACQTSFSADGYLHEAKIQIEEGVLYA